MAFIYRVTFLLALTLILLTTSQAKGAVYNVMTEDFHPFGYFQENGELTGIAVDITRLLLTEVGHPDNIRVLPWARALRKLETKPDHVLFAMARTSERENRFHWVGPIFSDTIYFFQHADNPIYFANLEQAKNAEYVAVTRSFPEQKLLSEINFTNLLLTNSPLQNVKLLMSKRVPLMVAGAAIVPDLVKHSGYKPEDIKRTGIKLFGTDLYIAFSANVPQEEVQRWQVALDKLKATHAYKAVLRKYDLN